MNLRPVLTLPSVALVLAAMAVPARAGTAVADLALIDLTADVTHAHVHQSVLFNAVATDLGPDPIVGDSLDIAIVRTEGLRVTDEICSGGISPDTPSCEFGERRVGEPVSVTVAAVVTAAAARLGYASITFCTQDEAPELLTDPDPSNNCATLSLPVRR